MDQNYEVFINLLPDIIQSHRNKFALMKDEEVIGYFTTIEDAILAGDLMYAGAPFSVQEVTGILIIRA